MSVISKLSVYSHCNDLGGKVWNPAIKWTQKHAVFVRLEDTEGNEGIGECWCFDSSPDALVAFLRTELAPHLLGLDVADHAALVSGLRSKATLSARHGILASALSGIDIALWDLRSKMAQQPLWKFLRAQGLHSNMPDGCVYLYASGGLYGEDKTTADLITEMQAWQAENFNMLKMKVGALTIEEDLQRVQSVLAALNDECQIIIDGVYSYTAEQAQRFFASLDSDRVIAFQSPVDAADLSGMQSLVESKLPVMGTEAEYRHEIHSELVDRNAVKFLQTAPIACGGISRLIELNKLVEDTPIFLSLEVSSTAIALMVACQFAAATHSVAHTEYHTLHQVFFEELNIKPIRGNAGWYQLPARPGLGIDLPQSQLKVEFQQSLAN